MQLSIREAKARLSEAIAAMENGERVVVTRFGKEVAELRAPEPAKRGLDFPAFEAFRKQQGWVDGAMRLPDNFNDPAFSRKVLGLDY
jgi:antitoxin (DNA-binding transcriptional repressor) of toxin-antitoxin stability system